MVIRELSNKMKIDLDNLAYEFSKSKDKSVENKFKLIKEFMNENKRNNNYQAILYYLNIINESKRYDDIILKEIMNNIDINKVDVNNENFLMVYLKESTTTKDSLISYSRMSDAVAKELVDKTDLNHRDMYGQNIFTNLNRYTNQSGNLIHYLVEEMPKEEFYYAAYLYILYYSEDYHLYLEKAGKTKLRLEAFKNLNRFLNDSDVEDVNHIQKTVLSMYEVPHKDEMMKDIILNNLLMVFNEGTKEEKYERLILLSENQLSINEENRELLLNVLVNNANSTKALKSAKESLIEKYGDNTRHVYFIDNLFADMSKLEIEKVLKEEGDLVKRRKI